MKEKLQDIQPVQWTGALRHCGMWLTSSDEDVVYENPNYNYATPKETVIYCVHGTADGNNAFSIVARRLVKNLPDHISSIRLVAFSRRFHGLGIKEFAHELQQKIKANGDKSVILMGHSRGGLVCAYFDLYLASIAEVSVEHVFAIGTPFYGSNLAIAPLSWVSDSVNEMQPGSEFLSDMQERLKLRKGKYTFFAAQNDSVVFLNSTFIPELSQYLIVLDNHGHLSMMSSRRLVVCMQKQLGSEVPELTIESACKELADYMVVFKQKGHIVDSSEKLEVLQRLHTFLTTFIDNDSDSLIQEDISIGVLIDKFLSDTKQGNGQKPYDILNSALINPFSFSNTATYDFIVALKIRYNNVPICSYSGDIRPRESALSTAVI